MKNILIVEDELIIAEDLSRYGRVFGLTAPNGESCHIPPWAEHKA